MKVLIVTSTPNNDGLTAACGEAARQGVVDGHSPARMINLNDYAIGSCTVCEDGWGTCKTEHRCSLQDDFGKLQEMFAQAEGYVWISPVYFGEPSEPMKAFFDRLRRCEMTRVKGETILAGKPTVCVAAAGGSGGGAIRCLSEMERWAEQLKSDPFDYIPITRRTREYQLETIHDALTAMCAASEPERVQEMPLSARRRRPSRRRFRRPQKKG
ncbi:flavodoxin family protein [Candidatus Acetothermia bacterium]|nr:MAG: flavodoxin family protein [Candidatus Acetothermia bacterium]